MLHHVANQPHPSLKKWCISHNKFLELLDGIEQNGLATTTFQEIWESNFNEIQLKNKVIITFDDCAAALFDFAIPELLRRKMKAVFYMPSEHIDGLNIWDIEEHSMISVKLMNAVQLQHLVSLGMEIGSHGEKHIKLDTVSKNLAYTDMLNSKKTLEGLLNTKVYSFAFPYGKIPVQHQQMLIKAGYKFGLSIYSPYEKNYALRRFAINETDDKQTINMKLNSRYRLMRIFYDPILLLKNKLFKA
ncbi:polysaccharide deacetylase family protein [Pedobacter mendelii]|uniref:Polysaccharide deacetylase n=2 Tax=Pedobacter mendelii TaxID=1908240 RepID=A0ABQ2BKQ2_9SPHI|nr:polysaccharide deacetylase [Pedobacter mendelii]